MASQIKNAVFIKIHCPQAKSGSVVLMIDTGADSSLIKKESLNESVIVNTSLARDLRGAFGGYTRTEGLVSLTECNGLQIVLDMHSLAKGDCLPGDGVLGRDNLWGKSIIDSRKNTLTIFTNKNEVTLEMRSIDHHQKGEINWIKKTNVAKAKSVSIMALKINTKLPTIIIKKQELKPGIYLGGSATRVIKGKAFAPILNATDKDYEVDQDFSPKFSSFAKFMEPQKELVASYQEIDVQDRISKIFNTIKTDENLNTEERASIEGVCAAYHDIFWLKGDALSCTSLVKHRIPIRSDQHPINQRQYRLPQAHLEKVVKHVKRLEQEGIVSPSVSPWNSPLLLVPKKSSEEGRLGIDFRKLNEATIKQVFPIPRMDEILDQLGRSRYFSTLDLASGYHQVEVDEEDREKTAFSTPFGHYEFNRMPFGLTGAPATFQRLMNHLLIGLQWLECFVYLDDIVIYGGNLAEHEARLCRVLQCLREHNLKVKTEECNFLRREIVYLGHKCSEQGALPDPDKVKCVEQFPVPRNQKEVQSFLGLVNYYRKFIPKTAEIALPINKLIRKDSVFKWSQECQEAFKVLKSAIASPPVLIYPDFTKEFRLTTDASGEAIGAVLSQEVDGADKPISFASRALCSAET